jgi:hypothetical protein
VLCERLAHLGVVRGGVRGAAQRGLALLALADAEVEHARHPVRGGEGRVGREDRLQLLERLPVLSLLRVDAGEQHPRRGIVGVGLHALLADDHRLHEPAGGEVRLREGPVRVGRGIGREGVLERGQFLGGERSLGGRHVGGRGPV